jgi:hypothetical protein
LSDHPDGPSPAVFSGLNSGRSRQCKPGKWKCPAGTVAESTVPLLGFATAAAPGHPARESSFGPVLRISVAGATNISVEGIGIYQQHSVLRRSGRSSSPVLAGSPIRPRSVGGTSLRCWLEKEAFLLVDNRRGASGAPLPLRETALQNMQGVPHRCILGAEQWQVQAVQTGEVEMPRWYRCENTVPLLGFAASAAPGHPARESSFGPALRISVAGAANVSVEGIEMSHQHSVLRRSRRSLSLFWRAPG